MFDEARQRSVCGTCLRPVDAALVEADGTIYLSKSCPTHGLERTIFATDAEYFRDCTAIVRKEDDRQSRPSSVFGAVVIEVIDDCNMKCPTCSAGSFPGAGRRKTLDQVKRMISAAEGEKAAPILMISGGEPTIHRDILKILRLAIDSAARRVFLITNGVRVARDPSFVTELAGLGDKLEIYLQFDSLRPHVLEELRGENLTLVRRMALRNLDRAGIPTSLVSVVQRGLNDDELDGILRYALRYSCVRGVTFQPIREVGRTETLSGSKQAYTLTEVRTNLQRCRLGGAAVRLLPNHMNPFGVAIGYFDRTDGLRDVTQNVLDLTDEYLNSVFYLPGMSRKYRYDDLFRIAIVSYADKHNFLDKVAERSCFHFVTDDLRLVPLEMHYLVGQLQPPLVELTEPRKPIEPLDLTRTNAGAA